MSTPLHPLACKFLGSFGNGLVFAHVEPSAWLVLNAYLGKLWDVLDEAVPGGLVSWFIVCVLSKLKMGCKGGTARLCMADPGSSFE